MKFSLTVSVVLILSPWTTVAFAPGRLALKISPHSVKSSSLYSVVPEKDAVDEDGPQKQTSAAKEDTAIPHVFWESKTPLGLGQEPVPYSELTIGVLKEDMEGETRVSQTPDSVQGLVKAGFTVLVQEGGETHNNRLVNYSMIICFICSTTTLMDPFS